MGLSLARLGDWPPWLGARSVSHVGILPVAGHACFHSPSQNLRNGHMGAGGTRGPTMGQV